MIPDKLTLVLVFAGALLLVSNGEAFAQSWGQYKEAAVQAQGASRLVEAEEFWRRALEASGAVGPRHVQSLAGLAKSLAGQGKNAEADETYKKFLSNLNPDAQLNEECSNGVKDYCNFLKGVGREAEAKELETRFSNAFVAVPAAPKVVPPVAQKTTPVAPAPEPDKWTPLFQASRQQESQKNWDAAEKLLRQCLPLAQAQKSNPASLVQTLAHLVTVCGARGKTTDCEEFSGQYVAAVRQVYGADSKEFAESLAAHAQWLRKLNRKSEAMGIESKAEAILARNAANSLPAGGSAVATPGAVDTSGTKGGSIYSRARSVQGGYTNRINDLLNQ